jgi:hypothetical protein
VLGTNLACCGRRRIKKLQKLTKKEIDNGTPGRTWYNPHHPVFNPNKPGKCRVVFDLSAKYHGVCLNNTLLKGPYLLINLIVILLRFRQYAHPVVADVEMMFHQVLVSPSDEPAFRFLWREPGTLHPPDGCPPLRSSLIAIRLLERTPTSCKG